MEKNPRKIIWKLKAHRIRSVSTDGAGGETVRQYIGAGVNFNLHCLSLYLHLPRHLRLPPIFIFSTSPSPPNSNGEAHQTVRCALPRVSSKWKKNIFGSNRNKICFAFVSVCFVKPPKKIFGLFRCFEPISKQPKQTELFRNEPKQSEIFWKIPNYVLYQNLAEQKKFSLKRR